jgi:hypothetical protein
LEKILQKSVDNMSDISYNEITEREKHPEEENFRR